MTRYKTKGIWLIISIMCIVVLTGLICFELLIVKKIEVQGTTKIDSQEIIKTSKIEEGSNMMLVKQAEISQRLISKYPNLLLTDIERQFPDTIILHVREREGIAAIDYQGNMILIDETGTRIVFDGEVDTKDVIEVKGLNAMLAKQGYLIECENKQKLDDLITLLSFLSSNDRLGYVESIDISAKSDVVLTLRLGYKLEIGRIENLDTKFLWMDAIIEKLMDLKKTGGTITVTGEKSAYYSP